MVDSWLVSICEFAKTYLNGIICAVAVIEVVFLVWSRNELSSMKKAIKALFEEKESTSLVHRSAPGRTGRQVVTIQRHDWSEFDKVLSIYQKKTWIYETYLLIIQLFPLFGILGTVAGLFLSIQSSEGAIEISSVAFALGSTVFGLLAAIVFKVLDLFLLSRLVNYNEAGIERFELNYQADAKESQNAVQGFFDD